MTTCEIDQHINEIMNRRLGRFFFQKLRTSDNLEIIASEFSKGNYHCAFDNLPNLNRENGYFQAKERNGIFEECSFYNARRDLCPMICRDCPRSRRKPVPTDYEKRFCCRQYVKYKYSATCKMGFSLDFQMPLKCTSSGDSSQVGELDLLLRENRHLLIAEAKRADNNDSLVKTILELETYIRILGDKGIGEILSEMNSVYHLRMKYIRKVLVLYSDWWKRKISLVPAAKDLLRHFKTYVIDAEALDSGTIHYFEGVSPCDY